MPAYETFTQTRLKELPGIEQRTRQWWELRQAQQIRLPAVTIGQPEDMTKIVGTKTPPGVAVEAYYGTSVLRGEGSAELEAAAEAVEAIQARTTSLIYATGEGFDGQRGWWKIKVNSVARN